MLQNSLKRITALLVAFVFGFSLLCVSAEPNPEVDPELPIGEIVPDGPMVVSVTDYGADGQDDEDDYYAFRQAMKEAIDTDQDLTVEIPAGTYYLDNEIPVYSHTTILAAEGATMIARYSDLTVPLLFGAHLDEYGVRCKGDDCTHGGYSQVQDVTIDGGVWDRGSNTNTAITTVFSFRHAQNITLKNLTVKNATDHLINLSGVDTALVENVTVQNHLPYIGKDTGYWGNYQPGDEYRYNAIEAIHLDYCNKIGEDSKRAKPFDNTPSKNITVTGCTFTDVYACVGTHHAALGQHAANVKVTGNSMKNVRAYCVYAYDFDGVTVENNTIDQAGSIGYFYESKATVRNNTLKAVKTNVQENGVYGEHGSTLTVTGNRLENTGLSGVSVFGNSTLIAENNTVLSPADQGIKANDGCQMTATGNTLSDLANGCGLYGNNNCRLTLKNNTVTNAGRHAVYVTNNCTAEATSNTIQKTGKTAIRAENGCTLTVKNNTVKQAGEMAVHSSDSTLTVSGNTIDGTASQKPGIKIENGKATISGNTIQSTAYHGVVVWESDNTKVDKNTIKNTAGRGIHVFSSKGGSITNNTITAAKGHAVLVEGTAKKPSTVTITGNTLASTGEKDLRLGAYAVKCPVGYNTLKNNLFSVDPTASYIKYFKTPKLGSVSNVTAGVTFKWSKSTGAPKYRVLRKTGNGDWTKVGDTTGTSYTDKTVKSGTTYAYTVRCVSKDGKTNASGYDSTGKTITYIAAPKLSSVTNGKDGITFKWSKSGGAAKYRVLRKTGSGDWTTLGDTTGTSYTDKTVKAGKTYIYTVRCISKDGKTNTSAYDSTGKSIVRLTIPSLKSATPGKKQITVKWGKVTGAKKYDVYRKTSSGKWTKIATVTGTSYTDKKAAKGTKYFYTVYAVNGSSRSAADTAGVSAKAK